MKRINILERTQRFPGSVSQEIPHHLCGMSMSANAQMRMILANRASPNPVVSRNDSRERLRNRLPFHVIKPNAIELEQWFGFPEELPYRLL
jgi:hypothetical protein